MIPRACRRLAEIDFPSAEVSTHAAQEVNYKRVLADAITRGGHPVILGGVEFAAELVEPWTCIEPAATIVLSRLSSTTFEPDCAVHHGRRRKHDD